MSETTLRDALARARAAGREHVILTTTRKRAPGRTIALARGLTALVVGTDRIDTGYRVVFDLKVADVERWIARTMEEAR